MYSHRIDPCPILMTCFLCHLLCYLPIVHQTNEQTYALSILMTISLTLNIDWLVGISFLFRHYMKVDLCWYHCAVWFLMNWLTRACVHVRSSDAGRFMIVSMSCTPLFLSFSLLVVARMRNNWMKHVSWFVSNTSYKLLMPSSYYITMKKETLSIVLSIFYNWKFKIKCQEFVMFLFYEAKKGTVIFDNDRI